MENLEGTPEPFKVKKANGMRSAKNGQDLHYGYVISMKVEPQDALGVRDECPAFDYKATIIADNVIEITAPLLEYSERGGLDESTRVKLKGKPEAHVLMNAMDNARHKHERKMGGEPPVKKYHLEFDRGVRLSAKVLKIHEDAGVLNPKELVVEGVTLRERIPAFNDNPTEVTVTDPKTGVQKQAFLFAESVTMKLLFRVADVSKEPEAVGSSKQQRKQGTAAAAALLG